MIQPTRIQTLNDAPVQQGQFVLYWMQASQRAEWNHALEYAIREGNELGLPALVVFGLTDEYPEANQRHYRFMLEGLAETQKALAQRGIQLLVRRGAPDEVAIEFAGEAALVVADRGYTRIQRQWRENVALHAPCKVVQVESDVIVPVQTASDKEEYAARTIRPKIHRQLPEYLIPLKPTRPKHESLSLEFDGLDVSDPEAAISKLDLDRSVAPATFFRGGVSTARVLLDTFLTEKLDGYAEYRSHPELDYESEMSPYIHFGQISPLEIALEAMEQGGPGEEDFLEELIVRRELAINFVYYNPDYDTYECLPDWARGTLAEHDRDIRPEVYSLEQLEHAETADRYWNAAQRELVIVGKMHNYMRMYWGKKIIEWTPSPERAFDIALYLNNKYELDGRDPNSFAGIAWCFGKHDRPWKERAVFGKVRYMNAAGLERKFDIERYVSDMLDL